MDVRDITQLYVAKNCDRTDLGVGETIDGVSVTGVQIHAPLIDAGTAAASYYGAGEVLVTDASGRALTTTIVGAEGKAIPEIVFHQRSFNGKNHFGGKAIDGDNILNYNIQQYVAPAPQVSIVHTIDATLTDYSYMLKIRRTGSDNNRIKEPTVKTVTFRSAVGGSSAAQIAAGLVAQINANLSSDLLLPVTAVVGGASSDAVIITASDLKYSPGKFSYEKLAFEVELVDAFKATVVNNKYADLVYNSITYDQSHKGVGTYKQVADMEVMALLYTGANVDKLNGEDHRVDPVNLNAQEFMLDGVTPMQYDLCTINWKNIQGDFSANVKQQGSVVLALPVEDNATNQVGVATIGIVAVLDAYIVTAFGVGTAQIGNIS